MFKPSRPFELKIKAMSIGSEQSIIHREEIKTKRLARRLRQRQKADIAERHMDNFWKMRNHREELREEARATHIARCFLSGHPYTKAERSRHSDPNWSKVISMIDKYGPQDITEFFGPWKLAAAEQSPVTKKVGRAKVVTDLE